MTKPVSYFNTSREHICKFCEVGFSTEKTLSAHMCVKKRRYSEKGTAVSMLAFRSFQRFFELAMKGTKARTFEDFASNNAYTAFIKFARYLVALKPIAADLFVDYLITNGIKLKDWTDENIYTVFLAGYLLREPPVKAFERAIVAMDEWGTRTGNPFYDVFERATTIEITAMIRNGSISPWILYLTSKSELVFGRLSNEQGEYISEIINSEKWAEVFNRKLDDVMYIKDLLLESNL